MQIIPSKVNFCVSQSKNCKNWLKFHYTLPQEIPNSFLEFLKELGKVEILDFSKFSKSSKVFYKMNLEHQFSVEGVLHEKNFLVTVNKNNYALYEYWQAKFKQWYQQNVG